MFLCKAKSSAQVQSMGLHTHTYVSLTNRLFSIAVLLYLWAGKPHPSMGVTNRPLPPHLPAHVQLPSGQWVVSPHTPISCHENGHQESPKNMLVVWLYFTTLIRDPSWVTLLVRSLQMLPPCRSLPWLPFLRKHPPVTISWYCLIFPSELKYCVF